VQGNRLLRQRIAVYHWTFWRSGRRTFQQNIN